MIASSRRRYPGTATLCRAVLPVCSMPRAPFDDPPPPRLLPPLRHRYPGTATLPDGRVIVVGGVTRTAATECTSSAEYNNPTYSIYDPATK